MPVPFIDLKRFEPDFLPRWEEKCREVSRNTMFVGGPEVARLEQRLQERSGAAGVVGCANGTDALQIALRAAGVGPGDVVLIPDATFWATFEAVVNVGARVVTVDIDMDDLQMDLELFKQAVREYRPKAAILVHLYGWVSAKLKEFRALCREEEVLLVEDGAQAFGVTADGESVYKDAFLSTISFYPAKVLGACGDAGAVYCSSEELAKTVRTLANHGRTTHYGHGYVGWNSRMGGFEGAYLNLCLDYIDERIESRRSVARAYRDRFQKIGVRHCSPPEGIEENGYLSVALFDPEIRPKIQEILKENGIGFGVVYPGAMSRQPGADGYLVGRIGGEKADLLCRSVLNMPLFAYMEPGEWEEALAVLHKAMKVTGLAE